MDGEVRTMKCPKHNEDLMPSYLTDLEGGARLEAMWCVSCLAEQPLRIPFRYEEKDGKATQS